MSVDGDHESVLRLLVSHWQNGVHHSSELFEEREGLLTFWVQLRSNYYSTSTAKVLHCSRRSSIQLYIYILCATVLFSSRPSDYYLICIHDESK